MQIALGQTVLSRDGHKIGVIERVLLNPVDNVVEHFVVHHGITLLDDMVIARIEIERVDAEGVHLALDAEATRQLPRFDYSFAAAEPDVLAGSAPNPFQGVVFFPSLPATPLETPVEPPLEKDPQGGEADAASDSTGFGGASGVVIGKGADVITADGQRVGNVYEVAYEDDGALESVTVQTGLLRHHRFSILADQIAVIGDEEILLNIPADRLPDPQ